MLRLSLGLLALPTLVRADGLRLVTLFQGASDCAVALGLTPVGVVDSPTEKPTFRYTCVRPWPVSPMSAWKPSRAWRISSCSGPT